MNDAKHTKGPWHWGNGFAELQNDPRDPNREYTGPKYADIGLWGPNGEDILPLRIDHYEIEWDSRNELNDLKPADRALIAAAPRMYDRIVQLAASGDAEANSILEQINGTHGKS